MAIGSKRVNRPSQLLANSITYSTTGTRTIDTPSETNQQTIYRRKVLAVIDAIIGEMERRFTMNDGLLEAVTACDPKSDAFLSEDRLLKIAETYRDLKVITSTFHV
jgi:hypothetical protein